MNWNRLGIRDNQQPWLQDRIRATNAVFKILLVVLLCLLISSLIFATLVMTIFIALSLVIVFTTILIHSLGFHTVSRTLVAILPVIVSSCIQGAYQMIDELPNASGWVFITSFQVLPFLLFAPAENRARLLAIAINLTTSASYEQFNEWIELDQAPATPPVQVLVTNMIGLLMMMKLLYTVDGLYVKANQANEQLIERVEKEREDQRQARQALDKTIEELNNAREQEALRIWASKGLADVAMILRDDHDEKLFDRLISFVVKYLSANQGAIFMLKHNGNEAYLNLQACYAYERKKFLEKRIGLEEGLVGQCYQERGIIYLTDVPENYIYITSGLGLATPRAIVLVPMIHNGVVHGVLEIASFKKFTQHQINFLSDIGESIAIAANAITISERTKSLLTETQMMAEQMKSQDEAMRQNMEEIAAVQEEQARTEGRLRELIEQQRQEIATLHHKLKESIIDEAV